MKKYLSLTLILISFLVYGQEPTTPQMVQYELEPQNWKEEATAKQIDHWDNGTVKIDYKDISADKKLRQEYFATGFKKLTAEVKQVFSDDTVTVYDLDLDDYVETISRGFSDILDGPYTEFDVVETQQGTKEKPITIGQYKDGKMVGKWATEINQIVTIANYNEAGELDGEYIEYHITPKQPMTKMKWQGQFAKGQKVGEWKHFDLEGKVLETSSH